MVWSNCRNIIRIAASLCVAHEQSRPSRQTVLRIYSCQHDKHTDRHTVCLTSLCPFPHSGFFVDWPSRQHRGMASRSLVQWMVKRRQIYARSTRFHSVRSGTIFGFARLVQPSLVRFIIVCVCVLVLDHRFSSQYSFARKRVLIHRPPSWSR